MVAKEGRVVTHEAPAETKRFSDEQRKALEKRGYKIFCLTGQSIKTLRANGREFQSKWHKDKPGFEALVSIQSEVAVNPDKFFLPNSHNKFWTEQEKMVSGLSQQLDRKIPGVKAIIGYAPDYIELACLYDEATKEELFKVDRVAVDYAAIKDSSGGNVLAVRISKVSNGLLYIDHYWCGEDVYIRVAPLIVPV